MLCIFLLVGCSDASNAYEAENFVPVQEYTGEGFTLRNANAKTGKIAEENREETVAAVEEFFLTNYKTEVHVHNIVSAVDGVSVFVESVGEPHFYTFAIVPVDIKNKEVKTNEVWSQEGQVENAIQGGLHAMAFADEFAHLETTLENIVKELPVVGTPIEAVEKVKATGFSTTHYFISPNGDIFDDLYDLYMENPEITKDDLTDFFANNDFKPEEMIITINLHMEEHSVDPSEEILADIVSQIEELEGAPRGAYSVLLHDSLIDKRRADGMKENTIRRAAPDKIIKE